MPDKIGHHHLKRKSILYVRQSSAHQVLHNRERSMLQYARRDRLVGVGWCQIDVVDDDAARVLVLDLRRNLAVDDLLKNCFGHSGIVAKATEPTKPFNRE